VLCLQEIKAMQEQLPDEINPIDGYHAYFYSAEKKGYSGTAIYSKDEPISVSYGIGIEEHDNEGRVLTAEYEDFFLVNVYTPNVKPDLSRLPYREVWDAEFLEYLKHLEETKPVVVCGDLNVAHKEIDLARPKQNVGNAGFTDEERQGFTNIIEAGFIDTFRMFNENPEHYSWWSYRGGARDRNVGWRIDYFCASEALRENISDAFILPEVKGSDHCPVGLHLTF
jgi:exodeoxyribonuclease-3